MATTTSMNRLQVKDLTWDMPPEGMTVSPDASLDDLLDMLDDAQGMRQVYVVDGDGRLCGSISTLSLLARSFPLVTQSGAASERLGVRGAWPAKVRELMKLRPLHVTAETRLSDAVRLMLRERVSELPVVDGRMRLLGEIGTRDLLSVRKPREAVDHAGHSQQLPRARVNGAYLS